MKGTLKNALLLLVVLFIAACAASNRPILTPAPLSAASPTPSVAACAAAALQQADENWETDWPATIDALVRANACDPRNRDVSDKVYAAYYNYGQVLLKQGKRIEASTQFENAILFKANGAEAKQAISELTPPAAPRVTNAPSRIPATAIPAPFIGSLGGTLCSDGWLSPSSGRGTCSHHGGEVGNKRRK